MADLGALNLILGADLSPLEASLGRADELINRSAAQMQKSFGKAFKFKVEVGDLAVQLAQAEGVVDRSIRQVRTLVRQPIKFNLETGELNVQLTEAEALVSRTLQDIKAMDRSIAFNLSVRGLDDVEGLVARSIQQMSALSNSVLTVQVDDKRLTELNQHLDAKQAHYARVQQQFATPLKVLVDDSQLTSLNQRLTGMEQRLDRIAQKSRIKLTSENSQSNLGGDRKVKVDFDLDGDKVSKSLTNAVEKGFKSAKGNPLAGIADAALSPLKSIGRGIFENLGRQLTNPLSKGIAEGLNQSISGTIGSQTLVGEKIGETIASSIKGKIGKSLGREIKTLSTDVLGQENIDRESGDASIRTRKTKAAKTKTGAEGLNLQRQDIERERIAALAQVEELKAKDAAISQNKGQIDRLIQVNQERQFRADFNDRSEDPSIRRVGNAAATKDRAKAFLAANQRILGSKKSDLEAIQADLQVSIAEKEPQVEKLGNKRDKLSARIDKLSPESSYSYRQIAEAAAGRKLKEEELPQLLVADARLKRLGGTAAYNATANTISVRKDLYDKIQSGNLDEQGYKETVHELTHGSDAGFGKLANLREYQAGRVPKKTYSAEEVAYAAPYVAQYAPAQRAKEMSAFAAEQRLAPGLFDKQNRANALNQFQSDDGFGFGGNRYQKFVGASQATQKQQLGSLVGLIPTSEVEDLIKIRQQLTQKSSALVTQINQSIGRGELAPGLENAIIANIGEFEQFEKILELTKAKASKVSPKTSSVEDPWVEKTAKSNPLAQAAGKAGEFSKAIKNEIALDKAAFGLAVDGTKQAIGRVQEFGGKFNQIAGSVGKVISPIAGAVNTGYQIAQGVENAVLPMIPFGKQIKSAGKNIALPAAAYAGMGLLPGGAAIQGVLGGAMHSALALPGAGAVEAIGGAVGSAFGGVPMLGGALTSASTALAGSVVEGAIAMMTPILAGKAVLGIAGQGAKLALPAKKEPDYHYIEAGQSVAQKTIQASQAVGQKVITASQSLVKTDYEKLQLGGEKQSQLPPAIDPEKDYRPDGRNYIVKIRQKLDAAINSGNKALAERLYSQFDSEVAKFEQFVKGTAGSNSKSSTITNQAVVGKWEKVKADRAKKISLIDDNESLRIEDNTELPHQSVTSKQQTKNLDELKKLEAQKQAFKARVQTIQLKPQSIPELEAKQTSVLMSSVVTKPYRQNQLLLAPAKLLGKPIGEAIRDPWEQQPKSTIPPQSKLLSKQARLETLNIQIYERKIQQATAILNQLALPPSKPLGSPIGEPIRDPFEQNKRAAAPQSRLLSREERLQALNTQIFERRIEQQSKSLNQLALPQGRDYSIPDPWAPNKPFTRVLEPPLPPRPKSLLYNSVSPINQTATEEPKPPSTPSLILRTAQQQDRAIKASFPADGPIDLLASKRAQNLGDPKAVYQVSDAARRFDVAYDRANKNIDKSLERSTKGINNELDRLEKGGGKVNPVISAFDKLTSVAKLGLGVFGGFTLASLAVPAMIALGKSTIDTAANFETLQVKLAAASDSAQTGKITFSRLTGEADKLGISRSSALETGAFIGGTTFGTELEGKPTDRMTSQILQIAQARGLNKQQTDGLNLALAQTLGRSRTSMQEINQLTQSAGITDARVIAAKGLGYTPQQFSAIQESPTGIDSKRFVQAFLAQGVQDSLSAKDLAQSSIGFKQTKLSAGIERLQGDVGAGISPAFKAGLDLLTGSIELLSLGIEKSSNLLIGIGIKLLYVGGTALLPIILNSKLAGIAVNGMIGAFSNLPQAGIAVAKLAGQFALMAVAGEVIAQVANEFKNSSQEIQDAADKIGTSIDEINGKKIDTINKPKTAQEIEGKDWGETAKLWLQRGNSKLSRGIANFFSPITGRKDTDYTDESFGIDSKQKEQADRTITVDNVLTKSTGSIGKVDAAIKNAQKLTEIDLEINRLDSQRSGLFSGGSPDAGKLADINAKYNAKYQERDALTSDITPTRNSIQETINGLKGTKAKLQFDFSKGQIAVPEYESEMALVAGKLQDAEQAQRKLNDAIKSGFDNLLPWMTSLDKIVASFDDIKTKADESAAKLSIGRNNLERGGNLTKGEAEYQGSIDKQSNIQTQIKQTAATIKELRAALLTKDEKAIENVQKNYGVDDSTSGTQLRLKADKATSVVDKEILSKLAIIKDKEINLTGLQSQFSDARTEMYRRIEQENRDAMLYYVGLAKQIDPQGTAFTKAIAQVTQDKNKLLSKLQGYGNGMFDGYIGAILDLFESSKKKLEALAQYANTRKSAIDGFNDRAYQAESTARNAFNAPGQQSGAASNYPAGQTQNPATRTNSSAPVEQPAPQDRTVRSAKSTAPSEYTRSNSAVKPQIDAALKRLTPEERNRYLNTTLSVNGKTDLGLDDYDRNVLGLKDRPKSSIPPAPTPRSSISPSPIPQPPSQLISQPASSSPVSGSSKVGRVQPITVGSWVQQSQAASQKIFEQEMQRGQSQLDTAFSDSEFQNITSELKAKREGKQAEQQVQRTARTQQRSLRGLKPTLTIQEKQDRELETFNDTASDSKEDFATFRQNMTDSVGDLYTVIKYLDSRTDLTPGQKKTLADAKARAARLGGTLKTVNTNFSQIDDKVKAARDQIVEQQGYERDVAVEQTGIKEQESKRGEIEAKRTGIQQQLKTQGFNSGLTANERDLEEQSAKISIENKRKTAQRVITEEERKGTYNIKRTQPQADAYVAKLRSEVDRTASQELKSSSENRTQKDREFKLKVDEENQGLDITEFGQKSTRLDISARGQAATDRTDSPFANNIAIDSSYKRKLADLKTETETVKNIFKKQQKNYGGEDPISEGLLARAKQQYEEATKQIELKTSTAKQEYSADTADRERSRRGVLYGQQVTTFDSQFAISSAQTQQRKLMGQDTREQDYQAQKLTKQKEFSQKEFDLTQQRSQITALTPEADAARAQIDGLLTNLKALESIELSNLSAQFNQLNQVVGETQKATSDVFKSYLAGGAFDFKKLLSSPFLAFGNQMVDKLVPDLFSGLYQKSPQGAGSQPQQTGDVFSGLFNGLLGGLLGGKGFATGGIKNGLATISNGIIGTGRSQIDNRLTLVEDGEAILTHRGIDALGGPSVINKINKGDIPRFASGGIKGANYSTPRPNTSVPNYAGETANLGNVSANVTINNSDGKSSVTTQEDGTKMGLLVNNAISAAIIKEKRPGGMLYN
jgi:hypothetical protein